MPQQVTVSLGVTVPSTIKFAGRRVDMELTLDFKKGETPKKALERCTKEVFSCLQKPLGELESVIKKHVG